MWIHFTTIHPTFMLIDTPPSKSESFTGATGFYIKHTSRKPRWQEPYNNALHLEIRCSYSFVYAHGAPRETCRAEQRADARVCKWKEDVVVVFILTERKRMWQTHADETGYIRSNMQWDLRGEYLFAKKNTSRKSSHTKEHTFFFFFLNAVVHIRDAWHTILGNLCYWLVLYQQNHRRVMEPIVWSRIEFTDFNKLSIRTLRYGGWRTEEEGDEGGIRDDVKLPRLVD